MELLLGNCLDRLKDLEDNSVDAIVTDPPYGLSFMGKKWDYDVPSVDIWKECLRVLKPGGYLLSFAGTRTQHRMAVNIEDAGFEIRDMIAWVYGSGFPKSLNIGKAVDKLQGNEREDLGEHIQNKTNPDSKNRSWQSEEGVGNKWNLSKGTSQWEGWGTALKPALEPITVARKPLGEKTVAENCLKWGVGGINIDGCRVGIDMDDKNIRINEINPPSPNSIFFKDKKLTKPRGPEVNGRFPANLIHDGSDEVVGLFPQTKSGKAIRHNSGGNTFGGDNEKPPMEDLGYDDSGSASRFFYCAKASKAERNIGCEGLEEIRKCNSYTESREGMYKDRNTMLKNNHPTVKPIALMEYLVKLVSREGQVILDPFMGSGTTGMACKKLNREFVGIEMMPEYMEIAKCRIEGVKKREQLNMI